MTSIPNHLPPVEVLARHLAYDPLSGALCRKIPVRTLSIMVDSRRYQAARICYALGHGPAHQPGPDQRVIHLNGDKYDTRLENLALDPPSPPDPLYQAVWG